MNPDCAGMLQMGMIGRAHGIKGELTVDWHANATPKVNDRIFLQSPQQGPLSFILSGLRPHKGRLLMLLEGVNDRSTAEKLNGSKIFMPRDQLPPLAENEVYLQDLPGCQVILPNGQTVGILDHIEFPANQEIWAITDDSRREILFPAQACFIESIDLQNRRIIISPPEGLLDIYDA